MANNQNDWEDLHADDWEDIGQPSVAPIQQKPSSQDNLKAILGKDLESAALSGEAIANVLATYDKYINAPVRKYLTEKVTGKPMEEAPTGKEQAAMMGLSTEQYGIPGIDWSPTISPAGAAGLGLEIAQDPLLLMGLAKSGIQKGIGAFKAVPEIAAEATAKAGAEATAKSATEATQEAAQLAKTQSKLAQEATVGGGEQTVKTTQQLFERVPPKSIPELLQYEIPQNLGTTPEKIRFNDVVELTKNDQIQPLALHKEMMENPKAMKHLKAEFDNLKSDVRYKLAQINIGIVNESLQNVKNSIQQLSPIVRSIPDQGRAFINQVKTVYQNQKQLLGPVFDEMKASNTTPLTAQEANDLKIALIENTKASPLLKVDNKGRLNLLPNDTTTGLSDQEYKGLKMVFNDIKEGISFEQVMNQRDRLRKMIDPANAKAYAEIGKARSLMLDKLEDIVSDKVPNMRETFKQYAINEKNLSNIEDIIGGQVEGLDLMHAANPETVVKNVLSNPNYAEVVKGVIGDQGFNELVASYLNKGLEDSVHSVKGFQPQTLKRFLNTNKNILVRSLPPNELTQLQAYADKGYMGRRFLDEVNPSGTAEALLEAVKPGTFTQEVIQKGPVAAIKQSALSSALNLNKQRQAMKSLNEVLSGATAEARAAAQAGGKATINKSVFENLTKKFPEYFKNMTFEDYLKGSAAGAVGRGVLKEEPKETPQQKPPDQSSIMEKIKGSPYEQILQNALNSGGEKSFAAANYVLKNRDPKYRKLFEEV